MAIRFDCKAIKVLICLSIIFNMFGVSGRADITHQNIWPSYDQNPIRHEITQLFAFNRFLTKFDGADLVGNPMRFDLEYDTLDIGIGYKYYFNSRYNHPDIPFGYMPYNYRSSVIEVAGILGDLTFKSEQRWGYQPTSNAETERSIKIISGGYTYYQSKIFHGLGGSYYRKTDDDLATDEFLVERKSMSATFGHHSPQGRFGIATFWQNISGNRKFGSLLDSEVNGTYFRIIPFLEQTPKPNILIATAFDFIWRSDAGDFKSYTIPLQIKHLNFRKWWEFGIGTSYSFDDNDMRRFRIGGFTRKFIKDFSVSFGVDYFRRWIKDTDNIFSMVTFKTGGELTFNRRITIGVSTWFGVGNDDLFYSWDEVYRYGLATAIRGNF